MNASLTVVTQRKWEAEFFESVGAHHSFGFEAVDGPVWAPAAWAVAASKSGSDMFLTSNGASWLDTVNPRWRGRDVVTGDIDAVHRAAQKIGGYVFVKLPEAKSEKFPATIVRSDHVRVFLTGKVNAGAMPARVAQVQGVITPPLVEIRFFITDGKASRGSAYLVNGIGWDDEERFQAPNNDTMTRARRFAEMVARDTPSAAGFSMDIGVRDDGTMFVIEANAAWSSAPYGDYPVHVKGSVLASQDRTRPNSDTWRFDMSQIPGPFPRVTARRTKNGVLPPLP